MKTASRWATPCRRTASLRLEGRSGRDGCRCSNEFTNAASSFNPAGQMESGGGGGTAATGTSTLAHLSSKTSDHTPTQTNMHMLGITRKSVPADACRPEMASAIPSTRAGRSLSWSRSDGVVPVVTRKRPRFQRADPTISNAATEDKSEHRCSGLIAGFHVRMKPPPQSQFSLAHTPQRKTDGPIWAAGSSLIVRNYTKAKPPQELRGDFDVCVRHSKKGRLQVSGIFARLEAMHLLLHSRT